MKIGINNMKHKPENPFIHGNYFPNTIIMSLPRNKKNCPKFNKAYTTYFQLNSKKQTNLSCPGSSL